MKLLFTILLHLGFLTLSRSVRAQNCNTFQEFEKQGIRVTGMDSIYASALGEKGIFTDQEKFGKEWSGYFEELMRFFGKNGLKWGNKTWCFNKIYFAADGKVEYWMFNFRKADNIDPEKQKKYLELIKEFSKSHPFPEKAPSQFTQCSGVTYIDL